MVLMREASTDPVIAATPVGAKGPGAVSGPMMILRPRLVFRLLGPLLIAGGAGGVAVGVMPAFVLVGVGAAVLLAWFPSVQVDDRAIRFRRLMGTETIPLGAIDEVRLRRVQIGPKRQLQRNFRIGRFCSTPLRLRVMQNDVTLAQITVVCWEGWPRLARYLLSIPSITSESRTRGRLDRYG